MPRNAFAAGRCVGCREAETFDNAVAERFRAVLARVGPQQGVPDEDREAAALSSTRQCLAPPLPAPFFRCDDPLATSVATERWRPSIHPCSLFVAACASRMKESHGVTASRLAPCTVTLPPNRAARTAAAVTHRHNDGQTFALCWWVPTAASSFSASPAMMARAPWTARCCRQLTLRSVHLVLFPAGGRGAGRGGDGGPLEVRLHPVR